MKYISFSIFCLLSFYCTLLPVGFLLWLGRRVGWLAYHLDFTHREICLRNLRIAFGDEWDERKIREVALESFQRLGSNFVSYLKLAQMPTEKVLKRIEPRGQEILAAAHRQGKGVILLTGHLGNWEIYARVHKFMPEIKFCGIYQKLKNPLINQTLQQMRTERGADMIDKPHAWDEGLKKLRENTALSVMSDQHAGSAGTWIPFFGRLASTTNLAGLFAKKTGAPVVPVSCRQKSTGQWIIEAHEPVVTEENGVILDPSEITWRVNQTLEKMIRQSPEDYFWVHKRWKTPEPNFLLKNYKRGAYYPPGTKLKPFKILIRVPNWLGDAVMSMPAVSLIKKGRPDAHVTILTREKLAGLWKGFGDHDEIISIPAGESSHKTALRLEKEYFDAAIILPNSPGSALPAFFAEIPMRCGYRGYWRRWLLTEIIPESRRHKNDEHQMFDYIGIARQCGADLHDVPLPQLKFSADIQSFALPAKKYVVVAPGAEYGPAKRWPASQFAEACRQIARQQRLCFVFVGLEGDRACADKIIQSSGVEGFNLAGKTSLEGLGTILQNASAVLSNDSGVMHLSSVLGTPTIAIFGSTDPVLTGPIGPRNKIIHHLAECSPCFRRECPIDFRCMNAVTAGEVSEAVLRRVAQERLL